MLNDRRVLPSVLSRQSARDFRPEPVPADALQRILEAGRHAPSGANQQPWHFVVIRDPKAKQRVRHACESVEAKLHHSPPELLGGWMNEHGITSSKAFLESAPVLIAVFFDPTVPYPIPSTWLAIGFMLLQIEDEGFSSLPYTPSGAALHAILGVPETLGLAAVLPIGKGVFSDRKSRKPLSEIASAETYGRRFND